MVTGDLRVRAWTLVEWLTRSVYRAAALVSSFVGLAEVTCWWRAGAQTFVALTLELVTEAVTSFVAIEAVGSGLSKNERLTGVAIWNWEVLSTVGDRVVSVLALWSRWALP